MWIYLNTPFLFALPGVETEEIRPWREDDEVWRRQALLQDVLLRPRALPGIHYWIAMLN